MKPYACQYSADLVTSDSLASKSTLLTWKTVFLTGFSDTAMQRARGAYFVNRHGTFWKELNFNFPQHKKNEIHKKFIEKIENI